MHEYDLFFVIPTYRLREVGETVEHYDEHFWRNGHSVRMIVLGTHLKRDTVIPQWFQASKAAAASDGHAVHC
jgi:hypothetical protein